MILEKLFENKGYSKDITFADVYKRTNIKLIIVTTNLNNSSLEYLSIDSTPNLKISTAVNMSSAIPILCSPVTYNNNLYIDGGCLNNYPIDIFKNNLDNVIGIHLYDTVTTCKITNLENYLINTIRIMFNNFCKKNADGYENYTINIEAITDFIDYNISDNKRKKQLFDIGYNKAIEFLNK
jgi:NTE family protein